jgi:hypothetical protein
MSICTIRFKPKLDSSLVIAGLDLQLSGLIEEIVVLLLSNWILRFTLSFRLDCES